MNNYNPSLLHSPCTPTPHHLASPPPGVMSLRYQPYGDAEPQVFLDIKANPRAAGDVAVRACAFDTATGLGVFSIMPLAKHASNKLAQVGGLRRLWE